MMVNLHNLIDNPFDKLSTGASRTRPRATALETSPLKGNDGLRLRYLETGRSPGEILAARMTESGRWTKPLYKDFPQCQAGLLCFSLLSRLIEFWLGLPEDVWP